MMLVRLRHHEPVSVGPLTGFVERQVYGVSSAEAIGLADSLLHGKVSAADLTIHDRDRLLAFIWADVFGERVAATSQCRGCDEKFDYDFALSEFVEHCGEDSDPVIVRNGVSIQLPVGRDELALLDASPIDPTQWLLSRCGQGADPDEFSEIVDRISPAIRNAMDGECPECGETHKFMFDVQTYVLTGLLQRKRWLRYEIHLIASAYNWSLNEILSLPREERLDFVELIEARRK